MYKQEKGISLNRWDPMTELKKKRFGLFFTSAIIDSELRLDPLQNHIQVMEEGGLCERIGCGKKCVSALGTAQRPRSVSKKVKSDAERIGISASIGDIWCLKCYNAFQSTYRFMKLLFSCNLSA